MPGRELEIIEWLQARTPRPCAVILGIGDDMAIVETGQCRVLFASDMLLDGVHFDSRSQPLEKIGRKAVACNLSDCAAMAVRPLAATMSVALPRNFSMPQIEQLFEGAGAIARAYDVALVGGDTTAWDQPLAIDVAMLAVPYDDIEPIRRSGARIGDGLYVTGRLGGSSLGRHLSFAPRVSEARDLARHFGNRLHTMMDISDGLSLDLWRMCRASGVGASLEEAFLASVVSDDARRMADKDGVSPVEHALGDGEDFELLLALEGESQTSPVPLSPVGRIIASGFSWRRGDGSIQPLTPRGYVH